VTASTASSRLRTKVDFAYPVLRASSEAVWTSPHVRELYPIYLVMVHGIVRSATPLMEAACDRARVLAPHDPVAAGLVPYLEHHAPEEAGHERWILEDLAALGRDPQEPLQTPPAPRVAELVGAQYYWLRHHHPVSLLGHMAVMEGRPPQPGFAARLRDATGYPEDAFRTVARHEQLDAGHQDELYELIDSLPLGTEHETMMGISALHTVSAAVDIFDALAQAADASPAHDTVGSSTAAGVS